MNNAPGAPSMVSVGHDPARSERCVSPGAEIHMPIETRPALNGITDDQRTLALAHWWLWRVFFLDSLDVPEQRDAERTLTKLETLLHPITLHRLAQARDRYWREKRVHKE